MRTSQRRDRPSRNIRSITRWREAVIAIAVASGMVGGGGEAWAQSIGRHDRVVAVPVPAPVTLDGDLKESDRSGAIESVYDPALADRFTATLAAMYDREALYLAAHVLDDTPLVNAHDPAVEPEIGWDGDAIQVRLTADASLAYPVQASTFGARQNEPLSKDPRIVHLTLWQFSAENKPCVRLERGMDYHGAAMLVGRDAPVVFRQDAEGQGYTLEARLPWRLLGATGAPPKAGDTLALTVQWLWGNRAGTKQIMTFNDVVRGPGFHYTSAANWGRLELSPSGRLAPARQAASPAALATPLTITVPVADAEAQQVSAALFSSAGDLVRTLPVVVNESNIRNQESQIFWDGLDDDGRPLMPGDYAVKFLTHRGIGQKYVTSVHNAGTPPWKTDDGRGSWGGDHGAPVGAASDGRQVYLIWDFSEAGHGLIAVDPQLRDQAHAQKLWGQLASVRPDLDVRDVGDQGRRVGTRHRRPCRMFPAIRRP